MKEFISRKLVGRAGILALSLLATYAMSDGAVYGRLTDADQKIVLEGAEVRVVELNVKTRSSRNGRYKLKSLPAGEYTIEVRYIGAETVTRSITVEDDKLSKENFALKFSSKLENVLVIGQSASLNKALNKQRSANNIVSVVNADAIGQYPDANTSEALQRLPGVSVENDQGEARYVRVRGLGADYNAVTINGSKVPSPDAGQRAVALDIVPSDLLESLEVTKALTPDMDADSIGGSINLKSLSAFDREGLFYKASAEANYDQHTEQTSPKLAFTGSNIFSVGGGDNNFGVAGALSWFERDFGSDNVETGGAWDFDDPARLEEFEQRDYSLTRERLGLSVNLDWKVSDHTEVYLRTLYSEYTDSETRLANVYELYQFERDANGDIVLDDEGDPETIDGIPIGGRGASTIARELKDRTETLEITSFVAGGSTTLNAWTLDYQLGMSESSEDTPYNVDGAAFELELDENVSFRGVRLLVPSLSSEAYDADSYELDAIETAETYTEDEEQNIRADVTRLFTLTNGSVELKFGGKISQREKIGNEEVWEFEDLDEVGFTDDQLLLSAYTGGAIDYQFGNMGAEILSSPILRAISGLNRDDYYNDVDSAIADYEITEDINAMYVMGTYETENLQIVAGVRHEQTDFTAEGFAYNEYEFEGAEVEEIVATEFENDYSHTLPSMQVRYTLNETTQLRGAWTNSVVRPTFEQLNPGRERDGDEVEFGNPLLDPLESSNLDFGIEYFGGYATYYSAFVFTKDIENFVYAIDLGDTVDANIVGPGEISEAVTFQNGESASVTGLELAASKKFTSLPEPWNGLLISANATWTDSDADIRYLDDDVFATREISLPSQSDQAGNIAFGYEGAKFDFRIAVNYKSDYLLEVSDPEDAEADLWVDSQTTLDLLMRWNASENLQVFFQGVNLGDEPYYTYVGNNKYNAQYEEYGPTYRVGVSFVNF